MSLQGIFCAISLNTSKAELRIDSVLSSLNREIAKRAIFFGRPTQKTYVIIKNKKKKKKTKIETVGVVDHGMGDNTHFVETTWTSDEIAKICSVSRSPTDLPHDTHKITTTCVDFVICDEIYDLYITCVLCLPVTW